MNAWADDPLNLVRIAAMLLFIAAFFGILAWLARPGAKRRGQDAAMIPLRDDLGRHDFGRHDFGRHDAGSDAAGPGERRHGGRI